MARPWALGGPWGLGAPMGSGPRGPMPWSCRGPIWLESYTYTRGGGGSPRGNCVRRGCLTQGGVGGSLPDKLEI